MSGTTEYRYENILLVVDPTRQVHPALERGFAASTLTLDPSLHIFIGVDFSSVNDKADNPLLYQSISDLTALTSPPDGQTVTCSAEICWSTAWQEAIVIAAKRTAADMILVSDYTAQRHRESGPISLRNRFSDAKWALLRNAPCPVHIVRPNPHRKREVILAAVNTQSSLEEYETLNDRIVSRGKWLSELYGAEFHVVNAYPDSLHYPDRSQLRRFTDMNSSRVHIKVGAPDEAIVATAEEINADVVILGTRARKGVAAAMRGNTSEKIMGQLTQDVLTLN